MNLQILADLKSGQYADYHTRVIDLAIQLATLFQLDDLQVVNGTLMFSVSNSVKAVTGVADYILLNTFGDVVDEVSVEESDDTFDYVIYLAPGYMTVDDYDNYQDELMETGSTTSNVAMPTLPMGTVRKTLTESLQKKIKVNAAGAKRIKYKCSPGFIFNEEKHACVKIDANSMLRLRRGALKAKITKRGEGVSFKARVLRKTKKALKFRKAFGLK